MDNGTGNEAIIIRQLSPQDIQPLRDISIRTFREAFSDQNAAEHMDAYIAEAMSEERLTAELANEASEFFFAFHEEELSGYLKINFGTAQTEQLDGPCMEIERIYVYASAYGLGVGQALLDVAITRAREEDLSFVWLGVWEHNSRAKRFYGKNGFKAFGTHIFYLGSDAQTDVLMKRPV